MKKTIKFFSIRYRIMGLAFLLISLTVASLSYLANKQMEELFYKYLQYQPTFQMNSTDMNHQMMGMHELAFLHSVHESLIWVGLVFVGIGLIASFIIAKNITTPLYKLMAATERIRKGNLEQNVPIVRNDEIGQLTQVFNQMSSELAQNEKARREFLANIAHELRTPLAIINGNLDSMIDGVAKPNMEKLLSMQEEVMRLTRLVKDLRDLSLAEINQLELHKQPADVNLLLQRACDMLTPLLEDKNLNFACKLIDSLPKINIDIDRMNQVFYNILINAIRYTNINTQIRVETSMYKNDGKNFVQIAVQDGGNGIAEDDLPRIFDQFYRSDKSRSRQSGGSGIGLSLAKQFVENHGGDIHAENVIGGGAKIVISLPIT